MERENTVEPNQLQQILQTIQEMMMVILIVAGVLMAFAIAVTWIIFSKAGQPGWTCLIPIYNTIVFLRIVGRPWWHLLLIMFVPIYGWVIIPIIIQFQMAKVFDRGFGFGLGLLFFPLIFYPVLAFGSSEYVGPEGRGRPIRSPLSEDYEEEEDRPFQKLPARRPVPDDSFEDDEPPPLPKKTSPIKPATSPKVKPAPAAAGGADKVVVQCSNCQKKLKVAAKSIGKRVKCPGCGTAFLAE